MIVTHRFGFSTFVCCCLVLGVSSEVKQGTTVAVTDGASLGAALKREDVRLINIRGSCLKACASAAYGTSRFLSMHPFPILSVVGKCLLKGP